MILTEKLHQITRRPSNDYAIALSSSLFSNAYYTPYAISTLLSRCLKHNNNFICYFSFYPPALPAISASVENKLRLSAIIRITCFIYTIQHL